MIMLHFGEEIRIGYLQEILLAVRSKGVFQEDAVYGCMAHRSSYGIRVLFEIPFCVTN